MSFFRGNEQLEMLAVTGTYKPGQQTLAGIRFANNTTIHVNLAGISVSSSDTKLTNLDQLITLKVIIDWGDGTTESVSPYYHVAESSINAKYQEWTSVSHLYSLHTETKNLTMKIYVYNSHNDCATIIIPITIQFQSLLQSGAKFRLISANITNNNQVSYVFNNLTDKSNLVVTSVD